MLMKKIQTRLELSFWDIAIEALSKNRVVQRLYREVYQLSQEPSLFEDSLAFGLTSLAGFVSGIGVFFLFVITR